MHRISNEFVCLIKHYSASMPYAEDSDEWRMLLEHGLGSSLDVHSELSMNRGAGWIQPLAVKAAFHLATHRIAGRQGGGGCIDQGWCLLQAEICARLSF